MNKKICNTLFFFICFCLIFCTIPKFLQLNFLTGVLIGKLTFYPLIIGIFYTVYCHYKYKNVFIKFNVFKKYIVIFLGVNFLSLIIGLLIYPYYNLILDGPSNQIEKLPIVLDWLHKININLEEKFLVIIWVMIRAVKTLLLDSVYTFFGVYMIYCWYHNNWKKGYYILLKAIISALIVIFVYSFVELFYLSGNELATNVLINITPIFHMVMTDHGWWPPLLWKNQLRSIFAEPSYFGIYTAFSLPFLWYKIVVSKKYKWIYIFCTILFTFCLFLTKARTGIVLFSGEVVLLILGVLYYRNKDLLKNLSVIICCCIMSFISMNLFIMNIDSNKAQGNKSNDINSNAVIYLDETLGSFDNKNRMSNNSRYSVMLSDLKIGIEYPILGVGVNLRNAYMLRYLPEMTVGNREVERWLVDQQTKGILKSGFPKLGEYTSRFAETGILGLIVFLIPPIYLLINLLKKIKIKKDVRYLFFTISFIGILTAGIGDNINITYCYWVLLGLGYAMCFGKSGDEIKHE